MKTKKNLCLVMALSAMCLSGCVDKDYDLSDIDTTVRVTVNDLVVPVNIDEISMKSIIDIDDDSSIKIIDGCYTYVKNGTFSTSTVSVPAISIATGKVNPVSISFDVPTVSVPGLPSVDIPLTLSPGESGLSHYDFTASNISEDIHGIERINGDFNVNVNLSLKSAESVVSDVSFDNFALLLPKGLVLGDTEGCTYDATTGRLLVTLHQQGVSLDLKLLGKGINLTAGEFDVNTHSVSINGMAGIEGGSFTVKTIAGATLPKQLVLTANINFDKILDIKSFTGSLSHAIADVTVPDININNLPDILTKPGTNLALQNPCLYISLTNPLAQCGVSGEAGFSITSWRGEDSETYSIDNGTFSIAANAVDNFCFSPQMPAAANTSYPDAVHVPYSNLPKVLEGNGLPDRLVVNLTNPRVPVQHVTDFMLGHDYGAFNGTYQFKAPLQLADGATIVYDDKIDGWAKDIEDMTVNKLEVTLKLTTDIPIGVDFTGYPIDAEGRKINNVNIECTPIQPNANNQEVKISITGAITGLDGIEFTAVAKGQGGKETLNPNMHILLRDIRPRVSGYYQKEL